MKSSRRDCLQQLVAGLVTTMVAREVRAAEPALKFAAPLKPDPAVDQAVNTALKFLANNQHRTGSWLCERYGEMTSTTSLALMAFFAAGHVPGEGPYANAIQRGLNYVLQHQHRNGLLVHNSSHGPLYCHGISTLMLAEAAGMVGEAWAAPVQQALEKAVKLILVAQDVRKVPNEEGGWRYQPDSRDSDLSVTGWQLLALRGAKNIGCDIPAENIDRAIAYVKRCANKQQRGFGYQPGREPSHILTGTGVLSLWVCGDDQSPELKRGVEVLPLRPLRQGENYFYYGAYYVGVAAYKAGGESWEQTRRWLFRELLSAQRADGSWFAGHESERSLGPAYSTSLAVLALSVEYGYLPIYQR